jgi:hypothetical protein
MRRLLCVICVVLFGNAAWAACPNSFTAFTNGTNADAMQVNANFNCVGLVLIGSMSANNSASVSFPGLGTTFRTYLLEYDSVVLAGSSNELLLQVGTGTPPTYATTGYTTTAVFNSGSSAAAAATISSEAGITLSWANMNPDSSHPIKGRMEFGDVTQSANAIMFDGSTVFLNSTSLNASKIGGFWTPTAPITAVQILSTAGNLTSGNLRLFGIHQ